MIYVDNDTGTCNAETPVASDYNEENACGNVYVSGTYDKSLTIAARNDVIVAPDARRNTIDHFQRRRPQGRRGQRRDDGPDRRQLRARLSPRRPLARPASAARRPTSRRSSPTSAIEAAILSVKHSFTVDNWDCGQLGNLTVVGAIAQKYRGIVQQFNGTSVLSGYVKNYWYDDRLRYRSPPYFLDPVDSAWDVVRVHEQVPAR